MSSHEFPDSQPSPEKRRAREVPSAQASLFPMEAPSGTPVTAQPGTPPENGQTEPGVLPILPDLPPTSQSTSPPDMAARSLALDIRQSWIVEAPAGSGKTGLLIQRFLRLLTVVDRPESVLALTFTNKATAEMRSRILDALELADAEPDPSWEDFERLTWSIARQVARRDHLLGWHLRQQPHRLNIRTIDALCGEIARSLPVLSGGIGYATPVPDASDLHRFAARSVLLQLGGSDETLNAAIETVLLHRDGNLKDCENLLAEMLATRDQWGELVPLSRRDLDDETLDGIVLPRLNQALESILCDALGHIKQSFPAHLLLEAAEVARLLAEADGYNGRPNPLRPCATLAIPPGRDAADIEHWRMLANLLVTKDGTWRKAFNRNHIQVNLSKEQDVRLKNLVAALADEDELPRLLCALSELPPSTFPQDQWSVAKALFRLLHYALIELRLLFAERELCDFTEIAMAAREVLREEDGAGQFAAAAGIRLEHLLVDEMQDTSSSQYELLEMLTDGWNGQDQTVFLVGDPKQSIYLFRQARVERFLHSMHTGRLGNIPLQVLHLTANFRSGQTLVEAFNQTFDAVFGNASTPSRNSLGVSYTAAAAVRPPSGQEEMHWWANPLPPRDAAASRNPAASPGAPQTLPPASFSDQKSVAASAAKQAAREEAETIAAIAHRWRERPLPPGRTRPWKIAVLVRSRKHALLSMRKLKEAGVPFRALEMEHLGERPEVLDAIALTRALLHPADRVAWLAILRSPACGLTLRDLHLLAAGDESNRRHDALPGRLRERSQFLSADAKSRLDRTLDVMDAAIANRRRALLAVEVERAWFSLGGNIGLGELAHTNLRRYLELLEDMEKSGESIDLARLRQRLEKLYAEPSSDPTAVEILTIHKAKGLEWDLVLLPGLHKSSGHNQTRLLNWMELPNTGPNGERQVLIAPIQARGDKPATLTTYIGKSRSRAEEAELKRLLYVAFTRARTSLQVFAAPKSLVSKSSKSSQTGIEVRPNTLLNAAWPYAEQIFQEAAETAEASTATGTAPSSAALLEFPRPPAFSTTWEDPEGAETFDIAAYAPSSGGSRRPILQRLPLGISPRDLLHAGSLSLPRRGGSADAAPAHFIRPEGSLASRALGNAVHLFLDHIAGLLQTETAAENSCGEPAPPAAFPEVASWQQRIHAVVRASGLSPRDVKQIASKTEEALQKTISDADGRWLLSPHPGAVSEAELSEMRGGTLARFRMDRSFYAGHHPGDAATNVLWIVDYKTTEHGSSGMDGFLRVQKEKYEAQLRTYAALKLRELPPETPVMLALYYPLLPCLQFWPYVADADPANADPANLTILQT